MKKTLVFSTKKVARKEKKMEPQEQEAEQNHVAPESDASTVEAPERMDAARQHQHRRRSISMGSTPTSSRSTRHRSSAESSTPTSSKKSRSKERTVEGLRPSQALLQSDRVTVAKCVRRMVQKRTDATLLVNDNGALTGILTDRVRDCALVWVWVVSRLLMRHSIGHCVQSRCIRTRPSTDACVGRDDPESVVCRVKCECDRCAEADDFWPVSTSTSGR